jgi:hypothetical protein
MTDEELVRILGTRLGEPLKRFRYDERALKPKNPTVVSMSP